MDQASPCDRCTRTKIEDENLEAFSLFIDSVQFGGGGFMEGGAFHIGKIGSGLQFVTAFRQIELTHDQAELMLLKMKVILSSIGKHNEEMSDRAGKTKN